MIPSWLHILALVSLITCGVCFLIILGDILAGHPQKMKVMNWVWPITALYFGPVAVWAYYALGRKKAQKPEDKQKASWASTFTGVTHCGAGCTLGDFIGDWIVFAAGWTLAGIALWPKMMAEFTCAYLLGIVFQYFAIVPMRHLKPMQGIWAAIKADTLSITAFEVGMFVWMALARFVFFNRDLPPVEPVYWLMMQIAMILGFATSFPMNWWLINKGWKEVM